ncbi:MAG: response regulator [Alphaproteobacteria bacterium]|nr:response regulator [Alphaproteobacteria bacterium]
MTETNFINILIAEDNEISREMMASVLRTQGYNIHGAIDGETAIKVIQDYAIDVALVDLNMSPVGGLEFVRYLVTEGSKIPVVIITGDDSADILTEASSLGVRRVLQKPVEPDRLIELVRRVLKREGINPTPMGVEVHETHFSPEELMLKTIALADQNARARHGGPFGAIVADKEGHILGEGKNGITSRVDPTAHAEVMAIRKAADKLGKSDLSECIIYCSSQPTSVGKAVIKSVGIKQVYFGLTSDDIGQIRLNITPDEPEYKQLCQDKALEMIKNLSKQS